MTNKTLRAEQEKKIKALQKLGVVDGQKWKVFVTSESQKVLERENQERDFLRKVYVSQAIKSNRKSNNEIWISALWCSKVVGKYEKEGTLGLASDMNVSSDTVEDRAHAYFIFEELCKWDNGMYRRFVFDARRAPYIFWSHFRALWDAKRAYNLNTLQVLELLMDIVQSEGTISSRGVDGHTRDRFGVERPWNYYRARASSAIVKALGHPDLPKELRDVLQDAFTELGKYA